MSEVDQLRRQGICVLRSAFEKSEIAAAREIVLGNRSMLMRTRPSPSSGHLASFHRRPELEPLHHLMTQNIAIRQLLETALDGERTCTIGLSDITVNRSQPWHVDLLRGKYACHLDGLDIWNPVEGGVYKVLAYLNDADSLKIVPGSHLTPMSLDSDERARPRADTAVLPVPVHAGDAVVMDIRCVHRGSDEETYLSGKWDEHPRILVSTVVGGIGRKLTHALEAGNFARLHDWQARWGQSDSQPHNMPGAR